MPLDVYQCLMGVPIEEYEKCFRKWIERLKRCVLAGGEHSEGQSKLKWTKQFHYMSTDVSDIILEHRS